MNPAQVLAYPNVNGCEMSFASMEIKLGGLSVISGFKAFNYTEKLSFAKLWGNKVTKQGRTRGQLDATGSIELWRTQWDALLEQLTMAGAIGYSERSWPVTVSYAEIGAIDVKSDELAGVRFHSPDTGGSEGTEALTVKLELDIMEIIWHGSGAPKRALSSVFSTVPGRGA